MVPQPATFAANPKLVKSHNFQKIDCGILRLKTERDINKEKGEIYFYNGRIGIRVPLDL